MSVHQRERRYYPSEEDVPMDGPNVYGLTKRFSEEICRCFAREHDMGLAALRITGPCTRAQFLRQYTNSPRRPWELRCILQMRKIYLALTCSAEPRNQETRSIRFVFHIGRYRTQ